MPDIWVVLWWLSGAIVGAFLVALLVMVVMGAAHGVRKVTPDEVPEGVDGIQYVGHGTVFLRVDGVNVLTDPVLTGRVAGVLRRFVGLGVRGDLLERVDLVLVSHGHPDHFQPRSLRMVNPDATFIVPRGLGKKLRRAGLERVREFKPGDILPFGSLEIHGVRTAHPTARNALGYILRGTWTAYFPGDTALSGEVMGEVGGKFDVDLALLPIGCYRGRAFGFVPLDYRRIHMAPEQVEEAVRLLRPRRVVPIHWGTFVLGTEPVDEAIRRLREVLKSRGAKLPVTVVEHGRWFSRAELGLGGES
ncbi:MAG: MBL fold metallo-hydrolase [Promethearchaeota archaeon]